MCLLLNMLRHFPYQRRYLKGISTNGDCISKQFSFGKFILILLQFDCETRYCACVNPSEFHSIPLMTRIHYSKLITYIHLTLNWTVAVPEKRSRMRKLSNNRHLNDHQSTKLLQKNQLLCMTVIQEDGSETITTVVKLVRTLQTLKTITG